jgi:hypothetical protein
MPGSRAVRRHRAGRGLRGCRLTANNSLQGVESTHHCALAIAARLAVTRRTMPSTGRSHRRNEAELIGCERGSTHAPTTTPAGP